jgi:hypothetical protein
MTPITHAEHWPDHLRAWWLSGDLTAPVWHLLDLIPP